MFTAKVKNNINKQYENNKECFNLDKIRKWIFQYQPTLKYGTRIMYLIKKYCDIGQRKRFRSLTRNIGEQEESALRTDLLPCGTSTGADATGRFKHEKWVAAKTTTEKHQLRYAERNEKHHREDGGIPSVLLKQIAAKLGTTRKRCPLEHEVSPCCKSLRKNVGYCRMSHFWTSGTARTVKTIFL